MTWTYQRKPNGYFEITQNGLGVGEVLFEDIAAILVHLCNKIEEHEGPRFRWGPDTMAAFIRLLKL